MQVRYSRTIRPQMYESETFDITVSDDGLPAVEGESVDHHLARLHECAYRQVLMWLIFKRVLTDAEAAAELNRFRKFWRLAPKVALAASTEPNDS